MEKKIKVISTLSAIDLNNIVPQFSYLIFRILSHFITIIVNDVYTSKLYCKGFPIQIKNKIGKGM